jgi:catechol 2,3-dioxygenase-like lactoylglutathione lyase family enzyme
LPDGEARTNKKPEVIAMIKRAKGTTLAEIMEATSWQAHTVRGFVSILGSKGGQKIESSKNTAAGFESSTLNHVSILVSDVPRSAAFYQRVFNLSVLDEDKAAPRIRLHVGKNSHLTIRKRNPAGTIDHFAIGVSPFNKDAVIRDLKQRGATPREEGDAGLHVKDPDGFSVQVLASEQG